MSKWMIAHRGADFEQISKDFNISPVTARLIRNRGVIGTDSIRKYLRGNLNDIHSSYELTDIKKASELLLQKIKQKSKIRTDPIIPSNTFLTSKA